MPAGCSPALPARFQTLLLGESLMNLHFLSRPVRVTNSTLYGLCLLALSGCGPSRNTAAVSASSKPGAARLAFASSAPSVDAIAIARVQPLYREAILACRRKQYQNAASLLERLAAQPGLNR